MQEPSPYIVRNAAYITLKATNTPSIIGIDRTAKAVHLG